MQSLPNFDAHEWDDEACLEDVIDWRSERERAGDSRMIGELEQALDNYHNADTEPDE